MDINLCYIEGISYIDTPYFANVNSQESYFLSKISQTIGSTFYPPHYRNKIRFDVSDINFNSQVNYLYFEYNSKVYYYFINKLEYINESIIELDIVMDVIQTYMFNIKITNGVIERKFINRWFTSDNRNKINRSYLRENVSSGLFTEQHTSLITKDLWLVVKRSREDVWDLTTRVTINEIDSYVPYSLFYLPLNCKKINYLLEDNANPQGPGIVTEVTIDYTRFVDIYKDPNVLDIYVIDYNPRPNDMSIVGDTLFIRGYKNQPDNNRWFEGYHNYLLFTYWYFAGFFEHVYTYDARRIISNVTPQSSSTRLTDLDSSLEYSKNVSLNTPFNCLYMPVLFDENYVRIEYGNAGGTATYPLYNCNDPWTVKAYEYYNIEEGSKIFVISEIGKGLYDGLDYLTYTYSNIIPTLTILNDAWSQYKANNHGRWVAAGMGAARNAISSFFGISSKGSYLNDMINVQNSDPDKYDLRFKEPTLKKSWMGDMAKLNASKIGLVGKGVETIFNSAEPLVKQKIGDYNAYYAPDTIRQAGDFISSYISAQMFTYYRKLKVNDYYQCGYYYHKNGYKVDEPVNNISNIFDYVKNRYYFNVLKMHDCDLHLTNYIENNEDIDIIKDRFKDGIRLWNVTNNLTIGDFSYDNVELDYINE